MTNSPEIPAVFTAANHSYGDRRSRAIVDGLIGWELHERGYLPRPMLNRGLARIGAFLDCFPSYGLLHDMALQCSNDHLDNLLARFWTTCLSMDARMTEELTQCLQETTIPLEPEELTPLGDDLFMTKDGLTQYLGDE